MRVFKTVKDLQSFLNPHRKVGKSIGFVPTLGALHEGHMSLIKLSKELSDISVCSIFVNPTQFNESTDLDNYPRTYDADSALLIAAGCDVLFYPSATQVYPENIDTEVHVDFGKLDQVMEGAFRPGHFDGVAQVVKRLLDIVDPHQLYMGQKDFQQVAIVSRMMDHYKLKSELIVCPIIREPHGLAMSSRNERLSSEKRKDAGIIFDILQWVKNHMNDKSVHELEEEAMDRLRIPGFRPEYFQIVDGHSLRPINHIADKKYVVACIAVWVEEVRLIDNIILQGQA